MTQHEHIPIYHSLVLTLSVDRPHLLTQHDLDSLFCKLLAQTEELSLAKATLKITEEHVAAET